MPATPSMNYEAKGLLRVWSWLHQRKEKRNKISRGLRDRLPDGVLRNSQLAVLAISVKLTLVKKAARNIYMPASLIDGQKFAGGTRIRRSGEGPRMD